MPTWKSVAGWPYQVSDDGGVRRTGGGELRPFLLSGRYLAVNLSRGPRDRLTVLVHRLVAVAFLGSRPDGAVVNHKDGVKTHNSASNLEYTSHAGNMAHSVAMGLHPTGEQCARAKLTEGQVRQIVAMMGGSPPRGMATVVAGRFGVTKENVSSILRGLTWNHVTGLPRPRKAI